MNRQRASPDPGLTGVAARGPGDVYAVGSNLPSINGGAVQGMILRWNSSTWSQEIRHHRRLPHAHRHHLG